MTRPIVRYIIINNMRTNTQETRENSGRFYKADAKVLGCLATGVYALPRILDFLKPGIDYADLTYALADTGSVVLAISACLLYAASLFTERRRSN